MNHLVRRSRVVAATDVTRQLHARGAGSNFIGHHVRTTTTTTPTTSPFVDTTLRVRQSRSHTTSSSSSSFIPDPTWSLQELELSKQHAPISDAELQTLAKRALLDLTSLDGPTATTTTREQLRQDLGNMMHMIEQVQCFDFDETVQDATFLGEAALYDTPRGVVAAPLRRDDNSEENKAIADQTEEAQRVWEHFLQPQTTKVGAHNYFSIETKPQSSE